MGKDHSKKTKSMDSLGSSYAPVVSVLGHVDHGKTTLLDAIRKTSVAAREHGGITQHIGASEIEVAHEGKMRKITFIDTPGHEAFSKMRAQGVSASDIVLLAVASDDGVMPQTKESIAKISEVGLPLIVVLTKSDLEGANHARVKQQILKEGVLIEGFGGEVPVVEVSAKTGKNIQSLLELILLVYDLSGVKKDEVRDFYGVVIDAKLDRKRGVVVSLVVKNGILFQGDSLFSKDGKVGKARAFIDTHGVHARKVLPGDAVEVLGMEGVVASGTLLYNKQVQIITKEPSVPAPSLPQDLTSFLREREEESLRIILKTQTSGEIEAIKESIPTGIEIILEGQGEISVSDVMMAKDFQAVILGFNVTITKEAKQLSESEGILYKIYHIIYELLDELSETLTAFEERKKEVTLGRASVLVKFEREEGNILGVKVLEGKFTLGDRVRLMRGEKVLGVAKLSSLRRGKETAREVKSGVECGALLSPSIDFLPGDVLVAYNVGHS